jgi:hypothetical protein
LVQTAGFFVQAAGRTEPGEPKPAAHVPDTIAQHIKGAPAGDLGRQAL